MSCGTTETVTTETPPEPIGTACALGCALDLALLAL